MAIKVKLENGVFRPLEDTKEMERKYKNKEIRIEILPQIEDLKGALNKNRLSWKGALKNLKINSVELQHKIRNMW